MNKYSVFLLILFLAMSCKTPEARKPVSQSSGSYIDASIDRNIKINKAQESAIQKIMEENPEEEYFASDKGFWYYYNVKDTLNPIKPKTGDLVTFNYEIRYLDGNPLVSQAELGEQTYQIEQSNQDLISGLKDGLKLMRTGETVTFLFPSHKAFGYYGFENKIGSNLPIRAKVHLTSIKQNNSEN